MEDFQKALDLQKQIEKLKAQCDPGGTLVEVYNGMVLVVSVSADADADGAYAGMSMIFTPEEAKILSYGLVGGAVMAERGQSVIDVSGKPQTAIDVFTSGYHSGVAFGLQSAGKSLAAAVSMARVHLLSNKDQPAAKLAFDVVDGFAGLVDVLDKAKERTDAKADAASRRR